MKILSLLLITLSLQSAFAGFRKIPNVKKIDVDDRNEAAILYNFRNGTYSPFFDWSRNIQSMDFDKLVIKKDRSLSDMMDGEDQSHYTIYLGANVLMGSPAVVSPVQFQCGVKVFGIGNEQKMQINLTIERCDVYAVDSSGKAKGVLVKNETVFMGWGKLPPAQNNLVAD